MHKEQTLLGFDFGMSVIGVAVGQTITQSATPLPILKARNGTPSWDTIQTLIDEWHASALVVGVPYGLAKKNQHIANACKHFARQCAARFNCEVHTIDEQYTSTEAKSINVSYKASARLDSIAAKIILESWLRQSK
jgi:putative holliday junction resolvase